MDGATKQLRVGRGYGVSVVTVADYALVGNGKSMHVLSNGRPLCGARGMVGKVAFDVDARAERVARIPVCVTCRQKVGDVPMPWLAKDGSE